MTEQSPARPSPRARLLKVARVGLTAAALAFLLLALATRWDEVSGQLSQVSAGAVLGAFACTLLGLFFAMVGWRTLLADLGSPLPLGAATRVLFLGQLAKYLPGSSVWAMVAQTELARDFGVPRKRAAAAALVLNLVTLGVGLLVTLLALPRLLDSDDTPAVLRWTPLLIPVGLAFLAPPVLTRVCNLLFRVLRRQPLDESFSWPGMAKAATATLGTWVSYGVQIALLAHSLGAGFADVLLPATGAFAAAWCAGFLVVVVPTGAGTREAVLTVALAPQLAAGAAGALTVAVVSRLLLTVADVVAALIGAALGRRRARPNAEPATEPV